MGRLKEEDSTRGRPYDSHKAEEEIIKIDSARKPQYEKFDQVELPIRVELEGTKAPDL